MYLEAFRVLSGGDGAGQLISQYFGSQESHPFLGELELTLRRRPLHEIKRLHRRSTEEIENATSQLTQVLHIALSLRYIYCT